MADIPIQRRLALELLVQGEPLYQVASALEISPSKVYDWAGRRRTKRSPAPHSSPCGRLAQALLESGWTEAEVTHELGVSRETLRRWRMQATSPRRPSQPHKIDGFLWLGVPPREIALRLNVSLVAVLERREALGLSTVPPGGHEERPHG